ncbi:MAG: BrnA antitoxin family protein [Thermomicrobiales bacterium]
MAHRSPASSPLVERHELSEDDWKKAREQYAEEIAALEALGDEDIDLSDMPEITDDQWSRAEIARTHRPVKQQLTLRLDADVVAWFRRRYPKYQTAMNAALRMFMDAQDAHNEADDASEDIDHRKTA